MLQRTTRKKTGKGENWRALTVAQALCGTAGAFAHMLTADHFRFCQS